MAIITKNTALRPGIRPAINLDFAGSESSFENRIRFTRASRATRYNKNGLIEPSNLNSPRVDFNPSSKQCRGLLVEESRTNFLDQYGASLGMVNAFYKRNAGVAPDGTYSAMFLSSTRTPTSVTCAVWTPTVGTFTAGQTYTASIYVKAGYNPDQSYLRIMNAGTSVDYALALINWSSGVPSISGSSSTSTSVGNGWYRLTATGTVTAGQSSICVLYYMSTGSAGDKDVFVWGPSLELGSVASSYIYPTIQFTGRTTAGSYNDRDGLVKIAGRGQLRHNYQPIYDEIHSGLASGTNNLRKIYHLTAGDVNNLRIADPVYEGNGVGEGTVTNLCSISSNMNTSTNGFSGTSLTITGETTAPDGSYNANKVVFGASNDRLDDAWGAYTNDTWYTMSVWVKGVAGTNIRIALLATGGGNVEPTFTLNGSWQRLSVRKYFTSADGGGNIRTHAVIIRGTPGTACSDTPLNGSAGNWASYVYVWGLQIEIGQAPTSFIPTLNATATRTADGISMSATSRATEYAYIPFGKRNNYKNTSYTTNLSSDDEVVVPTDDFTAYAEWNSYSYTNDFPRVFHSTNASSIENAWLTAVYPGGSPANDIYIQQSGGNNTSVYSGVAQAINTNNKIAVTYDRTNGVFQLNANGGTTQASGAIGASIATGNLYLGSSTSTSRHLNGWFRKVSIYNEPLSSNEIKELTR